MSLALRNNPLAIAREIMRAHGGDVVLAHTGEEGTTFRLTLPLR